MASDPLSSATDFEYIYYYHSSDPDQTSPAMLYLHNTSDGMLQVEYVSRGAGLTSLHGKWTLSQDEHRLQIDFNCYEGTKPHGSQTARTQLKRHPTILRRVHDPADLDEGAPENASWEGQDDKGFIIHLVHWKSFATLGKTQRTIDPL